MSRMKFSILLFCSLLTFGISNFLLKGYFLNHYLLSSAWSEISLITLGSIFVTTVFMLINKLLAIEPTKGYSFCFCLLFGVSQLSFFGEPLLTYNFSLTYDWMRLLHQLINMIFINFHLCFWIAKKYFFARENKNKKRAIIISSSLFLYVIGLYTPAYYLTTLYQPVFGYGALCSGFVAAFFGENFSGLANVFYFYALRCLYKKQNFYSMFSALFAFLLAAHFMFVYKEHISAAGGHDMMGLGAGYYFWLASMAIIFIDQLVKVFKKVYGKFL